MGKTEKRPQKRSQDLPDSGPAAPTRPLHISQAKAAERREALGRFIRRIEEEDAQRTPEEKAELDRQWALFKNSVNEARAQSGQRLIYLD